MTPAETHPRWYGFDLLRLFFYVNILSFHVGLLHFGTTTTKFIDRSFIIRFADHMGRLSAFSGFGIAFLSCFLIGLNLNDGKARLRLFIVLILGWLFFSIGSDSPFIVSWDVFALLFAGFMVMFLAQSRIPNAPRFLGILGYVLLWIPIWEGGAYLPGGFLDVKNILGVAPCGRGDITEWPILPWIGLVWFGYWLGLELRQLRQKGDLQKLRVNRTEGALWIVLLAGSLPYLGAYFSIRNGRFFSCDAYRQEPLIFWSNFIWPMALMRISLDPRVQTYLAGKKWVLRISHLAVSRKFWLAYLLGYVSTLLLAWVLNIWEELQPTTFLQYNVAAIEIVLLTWIFVNELATRNVSLLIEKARKAAESKWTVFSK